MTLRIERTSDTQVTTIRLIGELHAEQIGAVAEQIHNTAGTAVLDLDEVTLVDIEAVRFLQSCENRNIKILNSPPYIKEWMLREAASRNKDR